MHKHKITNLELQVTRLTAMLAASSDKNKAHEMLVMDHMQAKKKLEQDLSKSKKEEQDFRRDKFRLEKEKEQAALSSSTWYQKFLESQETIKLRDNAIVELNKKISEEKNHLKIQQSLYEQVRTDRNFFSKQHIQSQDQIAEMNRKFKILTHQRNQLKEEIQTKDAVIIDEHFKFKRVENDWKATRRKLAKRQEVLAKAEKVLTSQDAEIKNLRQTLREAARAQRQQKRVYDDVVQERV